MENKQIAGLIRLASQLMELHDENPFKVKSMANAAFSVSKAPVKLFDLSQHELEQLQGVGKSIASKIQEIRSGGTFAELEKLIEQTPEGIIDMLRIKGIGPKKIALLWKEMQLESVGELYYACIENRLVEVKGFGEKTQTQILQQIEFLLSNKGRFLLPVGLHYGQQLITVLISKALVQKAEITGQVRRCCEYFDELEILVSGKLEEVAEFTGGIEGVENRNVDANTVSYQTEDGLKVKLIVTDDADFFYQLFITSSTDKHLKLLGSIEKGKYYSEEDIYSSNQFPYIVPELREGLNEEKFIAAKQAPQLVQYSDLKGVLHNHTTYSDGIHSLKEMAGYCKSLGFEYLAICDHSQTAVYARGLQPERVLQQHTEIDELNKKLAPFRIFKGIESDILNNGNLDYSEDILKSFDLVVASVHSVLKMDEETANKRLIKAIENPYTTILGHPTGRLLLARQGYPINHKLIIDACAANNVIMELNANPMRLDMDWRWIPYAMEKGVMISINPDAHRKEGYHDMEYGVMAARKGALSTASTFNALSLADFEKHLQKKKGL